MKKSKFNEAMEVIGKREGISPEEVESEIQRTIDAVFYNLDNSAEFEWEKIPCKGKRPTPEEFVEYMSEKIKETVK